MKISLALNGESVDVEAEPRESLLDVLRDQLGLTGTHASCEQGSCGVCTVLLDGQSVMSCLVFVPQVEGRTVRTIEGVGHPEALHPLQAALSEYHGLQCGFCTPGVVMSALELLDTVEKPSRVDIERWMSGVLCRCTGYSGIVDAVSAVAAEGAAT
jgi:aerobic-type carbon monoxide dehydrogenase small subunit (CoxS/CutS family)